MLFVPVRAARCLFRLCALFVRAVGTTRAASCARSVVGSSWNRRVAGRAHGYRVVAIGLRSRYARCSFGLHALSSFDRRVWFARAARLAVRAYPEFVGKCASN